MTMLLEPFDARFEIRRQPQSGARAFLPPVDLLAGDDEVTLTMDVPGLKADDLEIDLADGLLRVRGERRYPYGSAEDGRRLQRLERGYGRFERRLRVPEDVDPSALTASIEDGVLTLRIPLPEARKAHRIEIRSGDAQRAIEAEWLTDGGHEEADGEGRALAGAGARSARNRDEAD